MSASGTGLIKSTRASRHGTFHIERVDTEARVEVHAGGIDILADRRPEHLQAAVGYSDLPALQASDRVVDVRMFAVMEVSPIDQYWRRSPSAEYR